MTEPSSGQKFLETLKLPKSLGKRDLEYIWNFVEKELWQLDFQGKFAEKQYAIQVFHQHIEEVKQNVPLNQLLVYQVTEGWESLCRFLDVPIPNKPFPCLNERATFKQRLRQLLSSNLQG